MVQANEYGGGRPWHKRVLIPFWLIQILFMGLTIVSASLNIWYTSSYVNQVNAGNFAQIASGNINTTTFVSGDGTYISTNTTGANGYSYSTTYSVSGALILYSIILAIAVVSMLFSLTEVILFIRHHLTPTKYFVFNLLKFLGWSVLFLCAVPALVLYHGVVWGVIINVCEELTFLGTLIYASVIYHRFRKERNAAMETVAKQSVYPQQGGQYGQA